MLLVTGKHVWTGTELLTDAAVLIEGERIREVGARQELDLAWPQARRTGGPSMMVLPGLINPHHHGNGVTSFQKGVADDALEPWIAALSSAPTVDAYLDTHYAALGLLMGGYTTVAIFQGGISDKQQAKRHANARIRACLDTGLRISLGVGLMQQNFYVYGPDPAGLPQVEGMPTSAYLELLEELSAEHENDPRVSIFAAPAGPQWVKDEAWREIGRWTQENGVPLHTHCLESPLEAEFARREYVSGSAVKHLLQLGALHELTSLVHGVYLTAEELEIMHERGASLITNPGSNLRLRCGVSPVLNALATGVNVAVATDGCTLGELDDAFAEMRLLKNLQRGVGMDTPALTPEQAVTAATSAAAHVTPWADELGSIQPGALADLTLMNLDAAAKPWTHPDVDPLHLLVQRATSTHVATIIQSGEVMLDAGEPTRANVTEVAERLRASMEERELPARTNLPEVVRDYFRRWSN